MKLTITKYEASWFHGFEHPFFDHSASTNINLSLRYIIYTLKECVGRVRKHGCLFM